MRVCVLGATGHTGRRVVDALVAAGAHVRACGRSEGALEDLRARHSDIETRRVDVRDAGEVRAALRGDVDAVANLAGPFLATGHVPVEAALRAGVPYADTTGEQAFMRQTRERYHERAQDAGVAVVNALAYEYAFSDLAARAHLPAGGRALHVLYRARGATPSAGTRKSILRAMAAPALGYEGGRLVRDAAGRHRRVFATSDGPRHAMSIPGGEPLTVPQHTPFATVRTYFAARPRAALVARALTPVARVALRGPVLRMLEARVDATQREPDNARARGEVRLVAEGEEGVLAHVLVRTADPYEATAVACAEGILRLPRAKERGVVAPALALDAADFLSLMEERLPDFTVTSRDAPPSVEDENHK